MELGLELGMGLGSGHTHPVYCLALTGSANAHTLVTASSDGRVGLC